MLTARDGDVGGGGGTDRFRIKVWDRANDDAVVYDNQPGDADDAEATTALGGGSVAVHAGGAGGPGNRLVGEEALPTAFELAPAYPNPFHAATTVRYGLPEAASVGVAVYDALGREVARLAEGERGPGWHEVVLDGRGLTPGVHLVRFHAGSVSQTQKVLLAR